MAYFSKILKKSLIETIKTSENFFCRIKLSFGQYDFSELREVVNREHLLSLKEVLCKKKFYFRGQSFFMRFVILYNREIWKFEPCLILLLLSDKSRIKTDLYKLRVSIYIRWLSLWCRLNKCVYENSVVIEQLENEKAEEIVSEFLSTPEIEENAMLIDEEDLQSWKIFPPVTLTGSFKKKYLSSLEQRTDICR